MVYSTAIARPEFIPKPSVVIAQNIQNIPVTVQDLSGFQSIITALNITPDGKYLAVQTTKIAGKPKSVKAQQFTIVIRKTPQSTDRPAIARWI